MAVALVLLAAVLALFLLLWRRLLSRLGHFRDLGLPYVPPEGLLAHNTFGVFSDVPVGESYDRIYKSLAPHPYGGFFNSLRPCLLLRDPRLLHSLFTTDSFDSRGFQPDEKGEPLEANIFFQSGAKWRSLRRKLSPTFTSAGVRRMSGRMSECVDALVGLLSEEDGREVDVPDLLERFAADVTGRCLFELDAECLSDPEGGARRVSKKFLEPGFLRLLTTLARLEFPLVFEKLGVAAHPREVTDFFRSLAARAGGGLVRALTGLKESRPDEFGEAAVVGNVFALFSAGYETTAAALGYTLYLLARDGAARGRAREEARAAKAAGGGRLLRAGALPALPYIRACVEESMRLYPPVQVISRMCTEDRLLEDGFTIRKGTRVFVPVYSVHRDPEFYPRPEEFRPERFLGEERERRAPGTYLPFGLGPRICLGKSFSLVETVLCVAEILDSLDFTLGRGTEEPLRLASRIFVVTPADGFFLRFHKLPV